MAERRITQHAIQRFIERVDRSATAADASRKIAQMAASGRVRPNPRSWTNCKPRPGTVFIYSVADPDACLVANVWRNLCGLTWIPVSRVRRVNRVWMASGVKGVG
jgi:hypothetical protein